MKSPQKCKKSNNKTSANKTNKKRNLANNKTKYIAHEIM